MLLGDVNNILIFTDHVLISHKKKKKNFLWTNGQSMVEWMAVWHNLNRRRVDSKSAAES